jgi:hypothetical protein
MSELELGFLMSRVSYRALGSPALEDKFQCNLNQAKPTPAKTKAL